MSKRYRNFACDKWPTNQKVEVQRLASAKRENACIEFIRNRGRLKPKMRKASKREITHPSKPTGNKFTSSFKSGN